MSDKSKDKAGPRLVEITSRRAGQRIDNFLMAELKGVPKSRIYRLLRKGEVRVNKGRCRPHQRLQAGDVVRIPPMRVAVREALDLPPRLVDRIGQSVLYEDSDLLVLDKPSGVAVHAGSGLKFGVVELLRAARPDIEKPELIHRLDRETSGCLMLAKSRRGLLGVQEAMKQGQVGKEYLALVKGRWQGGERRVEAPLRKNVLQGGERMVVVDDAGKHATSIFRPVEAWNEASLVRVEILTGRTHQIRVHAAHIGHPLAGDRKYGSDAFNKQMREQGLRRLFLHAERLVLDHPVTGHVLRIEAPLEESLKTVLDGLK